MKTQGIELNIDYGGTPVNTFVQVEEICAGTIYPVEMNDHYAFTFLEDEDGKWSVMREQDGITPLVEKELYDTILKKLRYELKYAA
jgi:hypothetical protein